MAGSPPAHLAFGPSKQQPASELFSVNQQVFRILINHGLLSKPSCEPQHALVEFLGRFNSGRSYRNVTREHGS